MKLRNKKTGEIINAGDTFILTSYDENGLCIRERYEYDSLSELCKNWEDYKPKQPLIEDEKIRKAVRAWADYHNITEVNCDIGTWDHVGICIPDSVLQLHSSRDKIVIQFFMNADKREKIKEGIYTIAELCGEEKE